MREFSHASTRAGCFLRRAGGALCAALAPSPAWAAGPLADSSGPLLLLAALAAAGAAGLVLCLRRLRSEQTLRHDREIVFKALAEACGGLAFVCDEQGRMEYVNAALAQRIGPQRRGQPCHKALFDRDETCPWCVNVGLFADQSARYEFQDPRDGCWYAALNAPVRRPGTPDAKLVVLTDITRDKAAAEALTGLQERHRIVAEYTHAMEAWLGPEGTFRFVSPACERLTGHPPGDFMAAPGLLSSLAHPEDAPLLADFLAGGEDETLDFRILRRDGAMRWLCAARREVSDGNGTGGGLRLSVRDITERKSMEIQMRYQALHDPMTGLANRVLASDRIAQAVERAKRREDYHFAVAFADVDRLRVINDSFGHRVGDKILEEIASRLHTGVRQLDMVARYGSDQFVLLLEELDKPRKAVNIIKRCRKALAEPVIVDGHELNMSVCFGAVLFPPPEDDAAELVRKANIALHLAKQAGYGRLKVFVPRMLDQAVELMTIERDLRRAVVNNEFFMEYQPILSLTDCRLKGFEALVRWRHPVRGVVPPTEFIPVAEELGIITDLGRFVLEDSCRTMSAWRELLPQARDLVLSVNLSARQFSQPDLVDCVRDILTRTGMPPQHLKLEITETAIMENAKAAVEKLNRLKELGIQISIDDFGTGYSSMSYLQKFPLDHLKIDLSFIRNMDSTLENRAIVKAIINLAHSLGLQVVAEGVEKSMQQEILTALECEYGQGYLFSRPVDKARARAYISGEAALCADGDEELILRNTPVAPRP